MKKIVVLLTVSLAFFACSKVGKNQFLITGTAKGIENGKKVILNKQNEMGMSLPVDTAKVKDGKFEMKGKITEPGFYTLQVEKTQGQIPVILENAEVKVTVDKDSIQKSKVSGTYNNDEFVKFNEDMKVVQKKLVTFQKANMATYNAAQQSKDTVTIKKLMAEYTQIQQEVSAASKTKITTYAETHPKSYITVLILEGMSKDPSADIKKVEKIYNGLDQSLKDCKPGKAVKTNLDNAKKAPTAAPVGPQPAPTAEQGK